MENTILKAFAKLNLSLNILPVRGERGYFNIRFINTQAALCDTVRISTSRDSTIRINDSVVGGEPNIAYRAAQVMSRRYNLSQGITIDIEKKIPLKAGLGGGSTDAAAVINALTDLFHLPFSKDERLSIARTLGMDVCYCLTGGLCRVEGIGDRVTRLPFPMPVLELLIATPPVKKPSTAWAYSILREDEIGNNLDKYEKLIMGIQSRDALLIAINLHNDFEIPIQRHYPVTKFIKDTMMHHGASGAILAGSGLSVFGIFNHRGDIISTKELLEKEQIQCFITRTVPP